MRFILVPILIAVFFYFCGEKNFLRGLGYFILSISLYAIFYGLFFYGVEKNAIYAHGAAIAAQVGLFISLTIRNIITGTNRRPPLKTMNKKP